MGVEKSVCSGGLASVQAVEEIVEGIEFKTDPNPNPLVIIDEVGSWLSRISSRGQTGNVSEIPSVLQTFWGWTPEMAWMGTKKVGKVMKDWYSVAFAIIGFSTEKLFFGALKKKEVASGFVNRMVLWNVGRGWAHARVEVKYPWTQIPEWLCKALREATKVKSEAPFNQPMALVLRKDGEPILGKDGRPVMMRDFRRMEWGVGARKFWLEFEEQVRSKPTAEERELWIRAPEIALRLATIVAVYRGSQTVEVGDVEWGIALAKHSTKQLELGVSEHMQNDLTQAELVKIIRNAAQAKSILTRGQVRKLCERETEDYRKIDAALKHLLECGDISPVDYFGPGQPTERWKWNGRIKSK